VEYQKAIAVLQILLDRHPLDAEEREAVMTAIGVLSWASLSKSKMKAQKAKRDKSAEW
jgi:hypothetical protein